MRVFFLVSLASAMSASRYATTVELIMCDVCHLAVDQVIDHRSHEDNFLHIDRSEWCEEDTIDEYIKALCDETKKVEGALWRQVDVVPGPSVVDKRPQMQWCGDECHMASKACFEVLEEHGETLTQQILLGASREDIHAATCEVPCRPRVPPTNYVFEDQVFRPLTDAARKEVDKALGMLRFAEKTGAFGPGDRDRRMDEIRRNAYGDQDADPWEGGGWGEEAIAREAAERKKRKKRKKRRKRKKRKTL